MVSNKQPIGVFDSGLGGLTVVKQIRKLLPAEDIIYIGDLAYLPYGNKSQQQIKERSLQCARFLLGKNAKAIVIACNSASAYAYSFVDKHVKEPVLNVIDAVVEDAVRFTRNGRIGVIATQATVQSASYEKKLLKAGEKISFFLRACPLFVSLVEEGEIQGSIVEQVATKYLAPLKKKKIDTLILGCTHSIRIRKCNARQTTETTNTCLKITDRHQMSEYTALGLTHIATKVHFALGHPLNVKRYLYKKLGSNE